MLDVAAVAGDVVVAQRLQLQPQLVVAKFVGLVELGSPLRPLREQTEVCLLHDMSRPKI